MLTQICCSLPLAPARCAGGWHSQRSCSGGNNTVGQPAKKLANHRSMRAAAVAPEPVVALGAAGSSSEQEADSGPLPPQQ